MREEHHGRVDGHKSKVRFSFEDEERGWQCWYTRVETDGSV